jgi:hypothetical protein
MSSDCPGGVGLSGDFFRGLCDHIYWCNDEPHENRGFRHGDIVFCKIDEVWRLFRALRRTRCRVVLVTGEGDKPVDPALWMSRPPQVAAWWGTNMGVVAAEARGLPLGLGNAGGRKTVVLDEIREARTRSSTRDLALYANFSPHSNRGLREPLLQWLREPAQSWITQGNYNGDSGRISYLKELMRHRFVLCPPGNGEDTHRFWESLYAGAFPVIRRSVAMDHFSAAPALVLDDLRDVDENVLRDFAARHRQEPAHCELLEPAFWQKAFDRDHIVAKSRGRLSLPEWVSGWWREFRSVLRHR